MRHPVLKGLVAMSALALGVAACGGSSSPKTSTATGKTLTVESTPLSPMTDTFNPFSQTSTGFVTNAVALYNEPLYIWNNMRPTQAPYPMLASGSPTWSNGGKTLTIPVRSGVKWNDGKPFTAADVAFTFNLLKANASLYSSGAPTVTSATAPSATSVQLNFSQPQYANLFLIGQVYIVPQHIWSSISNPSTFTDPKPVGTGPYMLDRFSPQGYTLKANPHYWNKSKVHVPEISFPSYATNANLVPPIATGQIDFAGNFLSDIQGNVLAKSPDNHTFYSKPPYFASNNVVTLFLNVTKAPLNDVKVRQAISFGINRQQISVQAEAGYEPPASSSSGLLLPVQSHFLDPALANDLPATGDAAKVASILKSDGYAKTNGKWMKGGKTIKFAIQDPIPYSDYYQSDTLISHQLNALGFDTSVDGIANPTTWAGNVANGTFDATIHWSNQGPDPYPMYANWVDSSATAAVGKPAAGDVGRYKSSAMQAALAQYAGSGVQAVKDAAIRKIGNLISTDVPVVPLMYGGAWGEYSTRNYTGWPTPANPYITPVPNTPYLEYTVLQLRPKS